MERGRDKLEKIKPLIKALTRLFSMFPLSIRKVLLGMLRGIGGRIGMLLRYILLKSITKRCGDNVSVHQYVFLLNPENLELGSNISIHPFCYIDAVGGIVIGDDVSIAHASTVMSSEHNYTRMDQPIKDQGVRLAKTNFSSDVWVGAGVRVLAGASIGQGVVLAAGSVVKGIIDSNNIYGGVPARLLKPRHNDVRGSL